MNPVAPPGDRPLAAAAAAAMGLVAPRRPEEMPREGRGPRFTLGSSWGGDDELVTTARSQIRTD
jgi:hypothetical protein